MSWSIRHAIPAIAIVAALGSSCGTKAKPRSDWSEISGGLFVGLVEDKPPETYIPEIEAISGPTGLSNLGEIRASKLFSWNLPEWRVFGASSSPRDQNVGFYGHTPNSGDPTASYIVWLGERIELGTAKGRWASDNFFEIEAADCPTDALEYFSKFLTHKTTLALGANSTRHCVLLRRNSEIINGDVVRVRLELVEPHYKAHLLAAIGWPAMN